MERYANKQNLVQLAKAVHDKYSPVATPTANGLMSAEDKVKVDGLGKTDDPTDAGPIVELTAKGWAEQDTTVGKNLLVLNDATATVNGTTATILDKTRVVISGTSTSSSAYGVGNSQAITQLLTEGQTYTMSLTGAITNGYVQVNCVLEDESIVSLVRTSGSPVTFTVPSNMTRAYLFVGVSGAGAASADVRIQLELGSTATDYEPYTGGAPSPSPSYPQEIRRVTGRNLLNLTRQVDGVNVTALRMSDVSVTNQVLTFTATGGDAYYGTIVSQGSSYTASNGTLVPVEPNTTYSISWTNPAFNGVCVSEFDESKVSLGYIAMTAPRSFTTKASTHYVVMRIGISNAAEGTTYSTAVQLELGSQATPYVPYGCIGVDATGDKNLLPNDATTQTINGVTFTVNADGSVTCNGTASAGTTFSIKNGISLPSATYTLSSVTILPSRVFLSIQTDAGNKNVEPNKNSGTFTAAPSGLCWIYVTNGVVVNNLTIYPQLELGTEATEYEPYYHKTIPIPLPSRGWVAALPDGTCDTLTLDGAGGYVWELQTGMLDLAQLTWKYNESSSSLSPYFNASIANTVAYDGDFSKVAYPALAEDFVITRRYAPLMTDGRATFDGIVSAGYVTQIQCKMTDITTVEDFVAALGDSSLLLYKAVTPTTESGYVSDMPTVPIHATISSTDLHDLTVRCCADEGAAEIASAWGRRYESRIANLESIVSELVAGA